MLASTPIAFDQVLAGRVDSNSVGLANVDGRLCTVCESRVGLVVETAPGLGAKVTLRIPKFAPCVESVAGN